jgi:excisionase family DNA binding protein
MDTMTGPGSGGDSAVGVVLLDRDEVAARLGVSERMVGRLVEERRIPYVKIGRFVRFEPGEIDRWLRVQRVEPRPAYGLRGRHRR